MKIKNKLTSVLALIMVSLITTSLPVFAKVPKQPTGIPITQQTTIPEVQYLPEEIVTGTGEEIVTPDWNAAIHTNIIREGIAKVKRDYPNLASRLTTPFTQYPYATTTPEQLLINGINWPDSGENDSNTWAGHFYDPDSQCNYQGYFTPTAYSRFNNHYVSATSASDKTTAWLQLSYSLHYFGDLNAPHHAANVPMLLTGNVSHVPFELYADSNFSNFSTNWTTDSFLLNSTMFDIAQYYSRNAKGYINEASTTSQPSYMNYAINNTLPYAQSGAAGMVYKFLMQTNW